MAVTLKAIVAATVAGSYVMAAPIELSKMDKAHFIQNKEIKEGGKFATRATDEGIAFANAGSDEGSQDTGSASGFELDDGVAMPAIKRGGGKKEDTYPFDLMKVGQSFHIAATADKPNPAKSMASTVSSANARYAVGTGKFEAVKVKDYAVDAEGKRQKDAEGKPIVTGEHDEQREVMELTRKFEVRTVDESDVKGPGARVWRTA